MAKVVLELLISFDINHRPEPLLDNVPLTHQVVLQQLVPPLDL